ncbi:MAG: AI-2E family transporter [Planctomycetota bacterium]|nr:AI-2E family transporter [Planctomycetota bacterium]
MTRIAQTSLIVAAFLLTLGALKLAAVAMLPLVAALLLALLLWPLRVRLSSVLPAWFAATICVGLIILGLALVGGFGFYAATSAAQQFQGSRQRYIHQYQSARSWLVERGLSRGVLPRLQSEEAEAAEANESQRNGASTETGSTLTRSARERSGRERVEREPSEGVAPGFATGSDHEAGAGKPRGEQARESGGGFMLGSETRRELMMIAAGGLQSTLGVVSAILLTIFLAYLALLEGDDWRFAIRQRVKPDVFDALMRMVHEWSGDTRAYVFAKAIGGSIAAVATGLWLWAMGVPLALTWAVLAFLLNYIPNVGAFLSGLPPVIIAVVELGWWQASVIAAGLLVIEATVGNLVDPMLQGKRLHLSTFVVLASLLTWGWLWGIAGAVMAPLLTSILFSAANALGGRMPGASPQGLPEREASDSV